VVGTVEGGISVRPGRERVAVVIDAGGPAERSLAAARRARAVVALLKAHRLRPWVMGLRPPLGRIVRRLDRQRPDAIVSLARGLEGNDDGGEALAAMFKILELPMVGPGSMARGLAADRPRALALLRGNGLQVAGTDAVVARSVAVLDLGAPTALGDGPSAAIALAAFEALGGRHAAVVGLDAEGRVATVDAAPDLAPGGDWAVAVIAAGLDLGATLAGLVHRALEADGRTVAPGLPEVAGGGDNGGGSATTHPITPRPDLPAPRPRERRPR